MSVPGISTGPRMNLELLCGSHATIALSCGWEARSSWGRGALQSSASYLAKRSRVTHLGSEEFSGSPSGWGIDLGSVRWFSGVAAPGPETITGRNAICAEVWISSRVSDEGTPGIDTTMLRPDCVVISASETPAPSTRWRMISTAWSSCSWEMS